MAVTSVEYISGPPPVGYSLAFEPFLYNQEDFLALKNYPVQSFYAVDHQTRSIEARIHFTVRKQEDGSLRAISLPELPFGSLEYSAHITTEQTADFLNFILEGLAQQNVRSIEIRDCAPPYQIQASFPLEPLLLCKDFRTIASATNHHIPIDEVSFHQKIHTMQRRRLKKCVRAAFTFRTEPISELASVYRFIQQCRSERGWNLSLTLEQLSSLIDRFPNSYRIFSVFDKNYRVAATVVVRVNSSVLYNFYPASLQEYHAFSPIVYLLQQVYDFAKRERYSWVDLGISTSSSLATFKERVGGILSYKKTYLLEW